MARGWESKSVEEQLADRQADGKSASQMKQQASAEDADRQRRRQSLELQREQILNERTSNPHRRAALQSALAEIEEQLNRIS
jgi:hypothetical protein